MIKACSLKSEFEDRIRGGQTIWTEFGKRMISTYQIKIRSVGSRLYSVCLLAAFLGDSNCHYCVARSYPMSYKSAYRLVCSL